MRVAVLQHAEDVDRIGGRAVGDVDDGVDAGGGVGDDVGEIDQRRERVDGGCRARSADGERGGTGDEMAACGHGDSVSARHGQNPPGRMMTSAVGRAPLELASIAALAATAPA